MKEYNCMKYALKEFPQQTSNKPHQTNRKNILAKNLSDIAVNQMVGLKNNKEQSLNKISIKSNVNGTKVMAYLKSTEGRLRLSERLNKRNQQEIKQGSKARINAKLGHSVDSQESSSLQGWDSHPQLEPPVLSPLAKAGL